MEVGSYVVCAIHGHKRMTWGRINALTTQHSIVELAPGVFLPLPHCQVRLLPDKVIPAAKAWIFGSAPNMQQQQLTILVELASKLPLFVVESQAASAEAGLSGAAIMARLASMESAVSESGGVAAGIVFLSVIPAALSAVTLSALCNILENDGITKKVVTFACVLGTNHLLHQV